MSTPLQLRRDSEVELAATTPAEAEPGYDHTNARLFVGDGAQTGGIPHASYRDVQAQTFSFGEAFAVGNEYRLDLTPPLVAYSDGVAVTFFPDADSQGAVTLNINGLGAVPVRKVVGASLVDTEAGDLQAGQVFQVAYINGFFQLLSREPLLPPPPPAGGVEVIASGSLAGSGVLDITSIPQDYASLSLRINGLSHVRDAGEFLSIRASSDNGLNFDTKSNHGTVGSDVADFVISPNFDQRADLGIGVTITGYQSGPYAQAVWVTFGNILARGFGNSVRAKIPGINALRLQVGSGTGAWSAGLFALYGIR